MGPTLEPWVNTHRKSPKTVRSRRSAHLICKMAPTASTNQPDLLNSSAGALGRFSPKSVLVLRAHPRTVGLTLHPSKVAKNGLFVPFRPFDLQNGLNSLAEPIRSAQHKIKNYVLIKFDMMHECGNIFGGFK